MGEALYRKYRSKNLDEVVGQEHVTSTLAKAIKTGKISHAYLLTGPRGTGKTSIARILAHEVNNLPYSTDQHLDIIEIDAASNRRIDEIRDIREKVRLAPTSAKYKVYIIDEVHMLTKEAFNALLKTLEEPPAHAIFILATTEVHKLPETIISRTQRYNLKPISQKVIEKHLEGIAKTEKLDVAPEALELIARHSRGGLRDALSMLDQLSARNSNIVASDVERMLGVAPETAISDLSVIIQGSSPKALLNMLKNLEEQGIHAPQIAHQLSLHLHNKLLDQQVEPQTTITLLAKLLDVPTASDPFRLLELTLLDFLFTNSPHTARTTLQQVGEITDIPLDQPKTPQQSAISPQPKESSRQPQKPITSLENIVEPSQWQTILLAVKKKHNTLYGIVRMAHPRIENNVLVLSFGFPFHQKRMNDAKNKQVVQDVIAETTGLTLAVNCVIERDGSVSENVSKEVSKQEMADSGTLEVITDIFGGGEILES